MFIDYNVRNDVPIDFVRNFESDRNKNKRITDRAHLLENSSDGGAHHHYNGNASVMSSLIVVWRQRFISILLFVIFKTIFRNKHRDNKFLQCHD